MAMHPGSPDLKMDATSLYREEIFTDRRIGTIRVLTPVTPEGTTDSTRAVLYVGEAQLLTQAGVLPLVFEIEARSLREAADKFADGANEAIERTRREIEELRREAQSSIIVPDRLPPGGLGGPGLGGPGLGGPGGLPGAGGPGGKIRLR
jgi:hypothetical protein